MSFGALDVLYTSWYTTPVCTLFCILGSLLVIFGTFGTPVALCTQSMVSVIPNEFWYICGTFVHVPFALYKLYLNPQRYNYFWFGKRNVHHIRIVRV